MAYMARTALLYLYRISVINIIPTANMTEITKTERFGRRNTELKGYCNMRRSVGLS